MANTQAKKFQPEMYCYGGSDLNDSYSHHFLSLYS